jgi:hypothetical protein
MVEYDLGTSLTRNNVRTSLARIGRDLASERSQPHKQKRHHVLKLLRSVLEALNYLSSLFPSAYTLGWCCCPLRVWSSTPKHQSKTPGTYKIVKSVTATRIHLNPYVFEWIGVELKLFFIPIHPTHMD